MEVEIYYPLKHLETLQGWWMKRMGKVPEKRLMAPTGYVVYVSGRPWCAGFLLKTDSKCAHMDHIVSDPEIQDKGLRDRALNLLFARLLKEARDCGYEVVTAACESDRLAERYKNLEFREVPFIGKCFWRDM